MKIHSIRWQLPASYAAIALLATLSLGAMLLFTLRRYYTALEQQYLIQNASSVSQLVGRSLQEGSSAEEIQASIDSLSFLSQMHIDVFDAEGSLLASTSSQDVVLVTVGEFNDDEPVEETFRFISDGSGEAVVFVGKLETSQGAVTPGGPVSIGVAISDENLPGIVSIISEEDLPVAPEEEAPAITPEKSYAFSRSMYALDSNGESPDNGSLSDQSVRQIIMDGDGNTLGSIRLSQGPAYGRYILGTVARGWLLAGSLAVLLAGGVGFVVSRRITRPLGILGETTSRMAQGELDMRANVRRKDEFGSLAGSFNHMADRIQETILTLRRFVADAAHELQTPITALHTDLELAQKELEGGRSRRTAGVYLPRALSQVERLKNLSASLLDLSRLESGEKSSASETLELGQLLAGLSESWAARAEQAGIEFTLQNDPEPVRVSGIESQLSQALENLLDNAIKFTPAGGCIDVSLSVSDGQALVQVTDSGIGIPTQDLPQLFSRFHRGSNASDYAGSGLGLAIVKAIVTQHGGSISCEAAEPGSGTVFRLLLPLLPEKDE